MSHPKSLQPCRDCPAQFEGTDQAKYCPNCRWKHRGRKPKLYEWTEDRDRILRGHYDSRIKGRAAELAARIGWPRWVITKRAQALGLATPANRKDWTKEEEAFVEQYAGRRHVNWMAKRLKRSLASVVLKLKRMQISRAVREGYTLRELELCFGTDHHVIRRWVEDGKLEIQKRGTDRTRDTWYVTDQQILRFIRTYPLTFRLDKVDQMWFMDLVLPQGITPKNENRVTPSRADDDDEAA